jgi:hypothetical protein
MRHSTPSPGPEDLARFRLIYDTGCVACFVEIGANRLPEIHHLTSTGRHGGPRAGHQATVGLCPWHHRGVPLDNHNARDTEHILGPSLARTPRAFRHRYGVDDALLELQNRRLTAHLKGVTPTP